MTPKLLRSFLAIIETGSLNRAASSLRLTQPALSRQVQLLEDELGVKLFARHGRGVTLTDEGMVLRDHADSLLRHIEQVRLEIVSRARHATGTLSIGLPAPLRAMFSGTLIDAFQAECPSVRLQVFDSTPHLIRERVVAGALELGIISDIEQPLGLICVPLLTESLFVAGPPSAGLEPDRPVPLDDIVELPLVQTGQQGAIRTLLSRHFSRRSRQPTFDIEADSIHLMIDLVTSGKYYTILPYSALHHDWSAGRICVAPLAGMTMGWMLVRLAERQVSVAARRMMDIVHATARGEAESGLWRTARLDVSVDGMPSRPVRARA